MNAIISADQALHRVIRPSRPRRITLQLRQYRAKGHYVARRGRAAIAVAADQFRAADLPGGLDAVEDPTAPPRPMTSIRISSRGFLNTTLSDDRLWVCLSSRRRRCFTTMPMRSRRQASPRLPKPGMNPYATAKALTLREGDVEALGPDHRWRLARLDVRMLLPPERPAAVAERQGSVRSPGSRRSTRILKTMAG